MSELARQIGAAHGGTDLLIDWRLIDCLRNGAPVLVHALANPIVAPSQVAAIAGAQVRLLPAPN